MDMNLLKYMAFVKTVEYGSFTKASENLHYSQSGISRMIGDLEREWHIALLERNRSGVKLTSDGSRLLPYARKLCEEYQKMQMQVDDQASAIEELGTMAASTDVQDQLDEQAAAIEELAALVATDSKEEANG